MDVVTGAFSYTGSYIARRLLESGRRVRTLSRAAEPKHPLAPGVEFARLDFSRPDELVDAMRGAQTLYNTYWIRFPRGRQTFDTAVANTRTLLEAAVRAGVQRVVHVSVSNPSADSPLPYYRGKAAAEDIVRSCGMPHAIVRPTLVVGRGDILINNIAWMLRRLPLFVVPGDGRYRLQPVVAEDVAGLAVELGLTDADLIRDAAGPDVLEFNELVSLIDDAVGGRARIAHLPVGLAIPLGRAAGLVLRDVPLTRDEVRGLELGLLVSSEPPAGRKRFSDFVHENANALGRAYESELARNFRPYAAL
jgi:uncharacterized protein YbjT (DUF2867 family)